MNVPHVGYSHCLFGLKTYLCVCEATAANFALKTVYRYAWIFLLFSLLLFKRCPSKTCTHFLGLLRFNKRVELVGVLVLQGIINTGNPR